VIYTITFNPALDYTVKLENLKTGEININEKEYILPGGKGINVSIILKTLGIDSIALGFIGGFIGEEIENKVKQYGIQTDFIKLEKENSRINVKIMDSNQETAINGKGPYIEEKYIHLFYQKLEMIQDGDILVLSGSIPRGMDKNSYQNICEKIKEKKVKIIIDATGDLLLETLKYHPFLIKPNQDELGEIFHVKIENQEDAIEYGAKLQEKGATNVLISMGKQGSVFLDENGKIVKMKSLDNGKRINTVGAGDSMVAGFMAGYLLYGNFEKALQMGAAAATATVKSVSLGTKEEIDKLLN